MTADAFREWMRVRRWSLTVLADALGVSPRTVTRWRATGTPRLADLALAVLERTAS